MALTRTHRGRLRVRSRGRRDDRVATTARGGRCRCARRARRRLHHRTWPQDATTGGRRPNGRDGHDRTDARRVLRRLPRRGRMSDGCARFDIPTQLRTLSGGHGRGEVEAATVAEVLKALDTQHPGFGERLFDETGGLRRFVNVFLAEEDIQLPRGSTRHARGPARRQHRPRGRRRLVGAMSAPQSRPSGSYSGRFVTTICDAYTEMLQSADVGLVPPPRRTSGGRSVVGDGRVARPVGAPRGPGQWAVDARRTGRSSVGRVSSSGTRRLAGHRDSAGRSIRATGARATRPKRGAPSSRRLRFADHDVDALYSVILPENKRSRAVAQRLGFTLFETRIIRISPSRRRHLATAVGVAGR